MTIFWKDQPSVLLSNVYQIIPSGKMDTFEWYNALTRLLVLSIIIIISTIGFKKILLLPSVIILFIYFDKSFDNKITNGENEGGGIINEHFTEITNPIDCQKPTLDNPFMNGLAGDNPARPPACVDETSQELSKTLLDHNLHQDVNDLWDKHNSQRQYYTNPSTETPDKREEFMKFCWSTPYSCRDGDQNHCLKYEDLRVPGYS